MMVMRIPRIDNKGAALVEFAVVGLLLITIVMGIIDWGLLAKDSMALNNAAREGARCAALGETDRVESVIVANAPKPKPGEPPIEVELHYRQFDEAGSIWGDWTEEEIPDSNNVQVRVRTTYQCNRVTGSLLGNNPVRLSAVVVMRRE